MSTDDRWELAGELLNGIRELEARRRDGASTAEVSRRRKELVRLVSRLRDDSGPPPDAGTREPEPRRPEGGDGGNSAQATAD